MDYEPIRRKADYFVTNDALILTPCHIALMVLYGGFLSDTLDSLCRLYILRQGISSSWLIDVERQWRGGHPNTFLLLSEQSLFAQSYTTPSHIGVYLSKYQLLSSILLKDFVLTFYGTTNCMYGAGRAFVDRARRGPRHQEAFKCQKKLWGLDLWRMSHLDSVWASFMRSTYLRNSSLMQTRLPFGL